MKTKAQAEEHCGDAKYSNRINGLTVQFTPLSENLMQFVPGVPQFGLFNDTNVTVLWNDVPINPGGTMFYAAVEDSCYDVGNNISFGGVDEATVTGIFYFIPYITSGQLESLSAAAGTATAANQILQLTQETKSATGIGTPVDSGSVTLPGSYSMISLLKWIGTGIQSVITALAGTLKFAKGPSTPITATIVPTTAGTITGTPMNIQGYSTGVVEITQAAGGTGTYALLGSADGTNFEALLFERADSGNIITSFVASAGTVSILRANIAGLQYIRVDITASTGGTGTVVGYASTDTFTHIEVNVNGGSTAANQSTIITQLSNGVKALPNISSSSDTFTGVSVGATNNIPTGAKYWTLSTYATGAVTSWSVSFQVSPDGTHWFTLGSQATNATTIQTSPNAAPFIYWRANCTAMVLGAGTNVISAINVSA